MVVQSEDPLPRLQDMPLDPLPRLQDMPQTHYLYYMRYATACLKLVHYLNLIIILVHAQ